MAEPALKLAPTQTEAPPAAPAPARRRGFSRPRLRFILLLAIPAVALIAALAIYLSGGRYISSDNA